VKALSALTLACAGDMTGMLVATNCALQRVLHEAQQDRLHTSRKCPLSMNVYGCPAWRGLGELVSKGLMESGWFWKAVSEHLNLLGFSKKNAFRWALGEITAHNRRDTVKVTRSWNYTISVPEGGISQVVATAVFSYMATTFTAILNITLDSGATLAFPVTGYYIGESTSPVVIPLIRVLHWHICCCLVVAFFLDTFFHFFFGNININVTIGFSTAKWSGTDL
jgi:hypothetical protein